MVLPFAVAVLMTIALPRAQETPDAAPPPAAPAAPPLQAQPAPPIVREVRFEGSTRMTADALALQVATRVGEPYSNKNVDRDLKLLVTKYWILGHAVAETLPDGGVRVLFRLEDVPTVRRVQFVGNREVKDADLRKALGVSELGMLPGGVPGGGALALLQRRLLEEYQDQGHLWCELDPKVERQGEDFVLVFSIIEGPEVSVDDIDFLGLEEFKPRHLRSLMKTSQSWWFITQTYKPKELDEDVVQIERFLSDEGFLDARVAVESVTPNDDGDEVDVLIRIDQGPRYTVHSVKFTGNKMFSEDELRALVKIAPGMPFRQTLYGKDAKRIREEYGHRGYIRATVAPQPVQSLVPGVKAAVDLTFEVVEGQPKRVRSVRVIGNRNTKDEVIRRELDLYPGQLFDGKLMSEAEDRLRATGFFADERGTPLAWVSHEKTDDERFEDIVMRVEDSTNGVFSVFGGISSGSGAFVGADLSIENFDATDLPSSVGEALPEFLDQRAFHGAGQKVQIRANPGNQLSNYRIRFTEPYLTGPLERPIFSDVEFHLIEYSSRFYDEDRLGGSWGIGKRLSRNTSVSVGLMQDKIVISNIENRQDPIDELLAVEGTNLERGLRGDFDWRKFDSLRNPTDGQRVNFGWQWFGGPFGADVDVVKLTTVGEMLFPIYENEDEQRHVLSFRAAAGYGTPYGDNDDVPYFEHFFAGGPSGFLQMRGFEYRGVGPHDGSFSDGGTVGGVINAEYIFPLADTYDARLRESQPFLRGVILVDQGILEAEPSDLSEGTWRVSVGIGLRMRIPLQLLNAPLEIYYAIPYKRADDDERESFQINFSTRF